MLMTKRHRMADGAYDMIYGAGSMLAFNPLHSGYWCISTDVKQTGWSQDQGPLLWALILAPACLPQALYFFGEILPKYMPKLTVSN